MHLNEEVLSQLVGGVYDAVANPELWSPLLQQLAQITHAESAGLVAHDAGVHTISHSWEIDPEMARLHQEHYHSLDVWGQRGASLPAGSVRTSQSLCPLAELKTTAVYNEFMARFRIEHGLFAVVEQINGPRGGSVSLFRSSSSPEFRTAEEEILCLLAGHLKQAFRLYREFSDLKALSTGLETALNLFPSGVIFLGGNGRVVCMNRAASAVVSEKDGLLVTRSGLRAEKPIEFSLLEKVIREATSTSNGQGLSPGGTVLVSRRKRPPLQIVVSAIRDPAITSQMVAAIVFIIDPTRRQRPALDTLQALYGLTPAECRVALLVGDGHAPRLIAGMVGVSVNTVRSQIKSVFSKTGVKRQGELIRLLMRNSQLAIQTRPVP
jgi:DNA-binding CsgD family transcriptional regulator